VHLILLIMLMKEAYRVEATPVLEAV